MSTNPYEAPSAQIQPIAGAPPNLKDLLFSFQGRIRRTDWWKSVLASVCIMLVAGILGGVATKVIGGAGLIILLPAYIAVVWIGIATGAKRMHDHGKSGWFQLVSLIPLVGIYIFILAGCMRGNVGPNAYGNDPV